MPYAPLLYEVASHVKQLPFRPLLLLYRLECGIQLAYILLYRLECGIHDKLNISNADWWDVLLPLA